MVSASRRDGTVTIEKGAGLMIVAPAYHRDAGLLPFANDFVPDIWLYGRARSYPLLSPEEPLPVTLNQYGVEFTVQPVTSSTASSSPS